MAAPDNWNLWALIHWEINIRSTETAEPCIKSFLYAYVATAWSLLHFFTGEGLQFFYRFHRDGQQDRKYFIYWEIQLEKRLCMFWSRRTQQITRQQDHKNRTPGEDGTGTGGTFNLERACCFWYSLHVVYFYTHWKNKVRWDWTQTMFVSMKRFGIIVRT